MKEKNKIIYIVVTLFTLIIIITGSTYAYFAITASNNNTITGSTANVGLTLAVNKITPSGNTTDYLVPQLESALEIAINSPYNCIDDNHNTVCQVYKATLTNTGSATEKVKGTITFSGINNIPHLKWKLISDATTIGSNTGVTASTAATPFVGETTLNASQSIDYYFVVWIDEIGSEQTDSGTYSGSITFTSSNGKGITSTIGEVTTFTGTKYTVNIYDKNVEGNNVVLINQAIPSGVTQYDTVADARVAFSNRPFYLKHTIVDDIVTESYVEFVVTPEMAGANSGMTAGTYTLRGDNLYYYDETADDWLCKPENIDSGTGECITSPYFETNKQTLLTAFGSSNCATVSSSNVGCGVSGLGANASADGDAGAGDASAGCSVDSDGTSACNS